VSFSSRLSWHQPANPLARLLAFERFLRQKKVPCTLRRSRGLDIEGACGQLRLQQDEAGADLLLKA
jgi:adenine C2-methylase RlmN of 23S rRNA A2503 and tRNA A37